MASVNSDWKMVGAISASRLDCSMVWPCIGMTERSINRGDRTLTYCGVGSRARLLSVAEPSPVPGTGSLVGPDSDVLDVLGDIGESSTHILLVHCTGRVKHFSDVLLGSTSSQNSPTARGPDAQAAAVVDSVAFQFGTETVISSKREATVGEYVADDSYRSGVSLYGAVDGENNIFTLPDMPADGLPMSVRTNGIPVTFSRDGLLVYLSSSPLCGRSVTASYYPEAFIISYTAPCAVFFGGDVRCQTLYALYSVADMSGCGEYAVICTFSMNNGRLELGDITHYQSVKCPNGAILGPAGKILVSGDVIYSFANGVASPLSSPRGVNLRQLTAHEDAVYALYGDNGVMAMKNDEWEIVLADGELTTTVQMSLSAGKSGVISGGECGSVQIGDVGGWRLQDLSSCQLVREVSAGKNLMYALAADGETVATTLHVTDKGGEWALRKTWPCVPADCNTLDVYADWLVHAQVGGATWRNENFGCRGAVKWGAIAESDNDGARLAVCHDNPNISAVVSRPESGSSPHLGSMPRTAGSETGFHVTENVYTSLCSTAIYTVIIDSVEMGDGSSPPSVVVSGDYLLVSVTAALPEDSILAVQYTVHIMSSGGSPSPINGVLVVKFN